MASNGGIPVGDYAKLQPLVQVAMHRRIPSAAQPARIAPIPPKPNATDEPIECSLCRCSCPNTNAFLLHLRSHRDPDVAMGKDMVREHRLNLLLTLHPGCNADTHDLRMRNMTNNTLEVRHMFVLHNRCNWILHFETIELPLDGDVTIELEKRFLQRGVTNTIVVQTVAGGCEYIEWHHLSNCCAHEHTPMAKLPVRRLLCDDALLQLLQRPAAVRRKHFAALHAQLYRTIDAHNYCAFFELASQCERIDKQLDLCQYTAHIQTFSLRAGMSQFCLQVPEKLMPNGEPCKLTLYDTVRFTPADGQPLPGERKYCEAEIVNVTSRGLLTLKMMGRRPPGDRQFVVSFHIGSYVYDIEVDALRWLTECQVLPHLFPVERAWGDAMATPRIDEWFNKGLNELQQQAVQQICDGTAYPAPYLLFGPPGTGKTKTLCEAIVQLWRHQPNSRILVCATSNAAADELAQRVVDHLPFGCPFAHSLYRLYAASCMRKVPSKDMDKLQKHSNAPEFDMPSWQFLRKFRVVVCTLVVAGGLRYGRSVRASDFTHVFIDESGSSTELASLLPIAVCTTANRINAHIILAGDPKQLGPVITSEHAKHLGYGVSLLERLMHLPLYAKHNGVYNRNVLTKLVQNYRSNPQIIDLVNKAFYDGELRAHGDPARTQRLTAWWRLPTKRIPIIFHAVSGLTQRELGSTSLHNPVEVDVIMYYVMMLLQHGVNGVGDESRLQPQDIGIISPYARQCVKIRDALAARGWSDVMVATVEAFQGGERPVILTSTVRSRRTMPGLGFLGCPKRLNVMITRAEALLIMVGDPQTLMLDEHWRMVLRRCQEMRVCVGEPFWVPAGKWKKNQRGQQQQQQHHNHGVLPAAVRPTIDDFNAGVEQPGAVVPVTETGVECALDRAEVERYLLTQNYVPCNTSTRIRPIAKEIVSKAVPKETKKGATNAATAKQIAGKTAPKATKNSAAKPATATPAKTSLSVSPADSAIGSSGDKSPVSVEHDDDAVSEPTSQYVAFEPYALDADPNNRPVCNICGIQSYAPANPSNALEFYNGDLTIRFPSADDDPSGRPLIMRCPAIGANVSPVPEMHPNDPTEDRDAIEHWMCGVYEKMKDEKMIVAFRGNLR